MADPSPGQDTDSDTALQPERDPATGTPPPTPRWVKVFAIIAVALLLLVVVMFVAGGHTPPIQHGP